MTDSLHPETGAEGFGSAHSAGTRRWLLILTPLLLALSVTVPSLFTRDLWNPDEPRYAEVSRAMLVSGDYLVPQLNGRIYAEKPPLFFWLSSLLQGAGLGISSGRLVAAAAAAGLLYLTFATTRLWLPARAAVVAPLVLGTSALFQWVSRSGVLDIPLSFFTMLSVYGLLRHDRDGGCWPILFYAGAGLATLTKGPVGALVPALAALALVLTGGAKTRGFRHAFWGVPLTVAIVAAWLVPAVVQGGEDYANTILFRQNLGRMVSSWSHAKPWYYYLATLPLNFMPWTLLLPGAFIWSWQSKKRSSQSPGQSVGLWFVLGFLVFSVISGKRERYLLPLYPALAILVAQWVGGIRRGRPERGLRASLLAAHCVPACVGVIGLGALAFRPAVDQWASGQPPEVALGLRGLLTGSTAVLLAVVALVMLTNAFVALRWIAGNRLRISVYLLAAQMVILSIGVDSLLIPVANTFKSARPVAVFASELAASGGGDLALFPEGFSGVYNLYLEREALPVLTTPQALATFLRTNPAGVVLTSSEYYGQVSPKIDISHQIADAGTVGHRSMVVLIPTGTDAGESTTARE